MKKSVSAEETASYLHRATKDLQWMFLDLAILSSMYNPSFQGLVDSLRRDFYKKILDFSARTITGKLPAPDTVRLATERRGSSRCRESQVSQRRHSPQRSLPSRLATGLASPPPPSPSTSRRLLLSEDPWSAWTTTTSEEPWSVWRTTSSMRKPDSWTIIVNSVTTNCPEPTKTKYWEEQITEGNWTLGGIEH
jgi:hypothetical protein